MSRRVEIEEIIVGTLLANGDEYWPCVRCCVTAGMFTDALCRELFSMFASGERSLAAFCRGRTAEGAGEVLRLLIDRDFVWLKAWHNEMQHLFSDRPRYTGVTFDDYVTRLVKFDG